MTSPFRRRPDFLPFSRPTIRQEEIDEVVDSLRSGWITTGQNAAKFEEEFSRYCGARHSVALASATGAMHVALKALDLGPEDEVITPAMTWVVASSACSCAATSASMRVKASRRWRTSSESRCSGCGSG